MTGSKNPVEFPRRRQAAVQPAEASPSFQTEPGASHRSRCSRYAKPTIRPAGPGGKQMARSAHTAPLLGGCGCVGLGGTFASQRWPGPR